MSLNKYILFTLCCLLSANCYMLFAQSFIQRLSWTPDEYALRYEIEIEKEEEIYRQQLLVSTEESFILVPLLPGNYRYRVTPYNLLDRPGSATGWMYFEINQPVEEETAITDTAPHWPIKTYLGINWLAFIDLQGETNQTDQFISGAALRISVVSSSLSFFNIGLELVPAWYSINSLFDSEETTQSLFLETNFLLQKQFKENTLAITLRAGVGMILPVTNAAQDEYQERADTLDSILLYANTGLSFLWLPIEHLYIEAGINYSYKFAVDNHSSLLRPWISVGTRL